MDHTGNVTVTLNPYLGTCKDCKWWETRFIYEGYAECLAAHSSTRPDDKSFLFRVASDDPAELQTHGDFGCIHFEAR